MFSVFLWALLLEINLDGWMDTLLSIGWLNAPAVSAWHGGDGLAIDSGHIGRPMMKRLVASRSKYANRIICMAPNTENCLCRSAAEKVLTDLA